MAHVGKLWPIAKRIDLQGYPFPWNRLPRKWFAHFSNGVGTAAAVWSGLDVVSSTQEILEDGDCYRWTYIHPTEADTFITFDWRLLLRFPSPSPTTEYSNPFDIQLTSGGILTARRPGEYLRGFGPWDLSNGWLNVNSLAPVTGIPLGTFTSLGMAWRWSSWDEQPEYHPYRWINP
jgi:hypothetical protein